MEHSCKHDQIQDIVVEITNISSKQQIVTNSHKLIGYKNLIFFKCMSLKTIHLVAHMQLVVWIWMDEKYKHTIHVHHMYNMSHATKAKIICMCCMQLKINCKQQLQKTNFLLLYFANGSKFRLKCWGVPHVPKLLVMGQ